MRVHNIAFLNSHIWRNRSAQDMIDYVLIAAFLVVAAAAVLPDLVDALDTIFHSIGRAGSSAPTPG